MKLDDYGVFRFEAEDGDRKVVMDLRGDSDIGEVVEQFKAFLLAAGFHPDNVKEVFGEDS